MKEPGIQELFDRLLAGTISAQERQVLAEWIARAGDHELDPRLEQAWKAFTTSETIPAAKADELLRAIIEKNDQPIRTPLHIYFRRYRLAAAAVLFILCSGALYWLYSGGKKGKPVAAVTLKGVTAPAVSNAVITLANGQMILLDSARSGELAQQGKTDLVKLGNGEIVYRGGEVSHRDGGAPGMVRGAAAQLNTITVPKGSRIASLTLSDGTKVWLNSGSSMTYPVAFEGKERAVSVNGEIYFEVAKDAGHPFVVRKGDVSVNVLGTHFNVNAYDDEANIRVTLLEGGIEVNSRGARHVVAPGEMAILGGGRGIEIDKDADLDQVMAWRNGRFDFGNADIHSIMRELSRWYGLEVEYREAVSEKFYLETGRDINVSDVFRILETTGGVHFQIEGKKIIVMR